ncbi:copper ion binding protein [Antricoccus suffuscus]|uniref:Copper ion binding protein n=1 Tax=Antricoccus suffuscus TaxID=1629062 RepID=A0A2T0Z2D3_9ACTN|nr:heavy-metal-associated domain-containing protein [Antricoccus suffuscus]PRZ30505.1 copper ion binding protein [Antricoccus suffuscus]
MSTLSFTVSGMTCDHCVSSVREEVSEISGVTAVDVVLESGALTVSGDNVDPAAVLDAVDEAGYQAVVS